MIIVEKHDAIHNKFDILALYMSAEFDSATVAMTHLDNKSHVLPRETSQADAVVVIPGKLLNEQRMKWRFLMAIAWFISLSNRTSPTVEVSFA